MSDLAPYQYGTPIPVLGVRAVGWCERGRSDDRLVLTDAERNDVLAAVGPLLRSARANPMRGFHLCDLCDSADGPLPYEDERGTVYLGAAEIWIPDGEGGVFAAPDLVLHYIDGHRYRPPAPFLQAAKRFVPTDWDAASEAERRLEAACRLNAR